MKELLSIVLGVVAVAAFVWIYLNVSVFLNELGTRHFGSYRWGNRRTPKVEIQTLFHGNTKDEDQI